MWTRTNDAERDHAELENVLVTQPMTSRVAKRGPCAGQAVRLKSRIGDKRRSVPWHLDGLPGLESRSRDVPCRRVLHG